jgi:hypothetical protein
MTKLYITEFQREGMDDKGADVNAMSAAGMSDMTPLTVTGTTQQSAACAASTTVIRLHAQVACSVAIGPNPTATTNTLRLGVDGTEYFQVPAGQAWKVAAILNP